jgi:hypothetical protein
MNKRFTLSLLGVFLLQSFSLGMPAFADRDDYHDNMKEARHDAREAAKDRAEARRASRNGHGIKAKLKRMSARHNQKQADKNYREARKELHDD